jgi:hypothetical protein
MGFWRERWEDFWEVPMVLHLLTWAAFFGLGVLVGVALS